MSLTSINKNKNYTTNLSVQYYLIQQKNYKGFPPGEGATPWFDSSYPHIYNLLIPQHLINLLLHILLFAFLVFVFLLSKVASIGIVKVYKVLSSMRFYIRIITVVRGWDYRCRPHQQQSNNKVSAPIKYFRGTRETCLQWHVTIYNGSVCYASYLGGL